MTASSPQLAGALRDRYHLERELGSGGMATVYLAEDLRHHRKVAIKVLHPELSAILGSERFLREIELTANLQHPHILGLFDSGDAEGLLYYVMPYIEGETLRSRLNREHQLPIADAQRIACEVADALGYAHRRNVVHRDIKPENILLHDGRVVVADFGIALAVQQASADRMTQTGLSLGTPAYMSPEQAAGDRAVDHRSDIYALGAVSYEMLTGEPPFTGPTAQAIIAKAFTTEPVPPSLHRRSVPGHVEAAVLKALEKLPADRFSSAADFAAALTTPASGSAPAVRPVPGAAARPGFWRLAAIAATLLALATTSFAAWLWKARSPATPPLTRRAVLTLRGQFEVGGADVSVAADGRTLATVDGGQVVVHRTDRLDPVPVPGGAGGEEPFLSADAGYIGYHRRGELVLQRLDGSEQVSMPFPTGRYPADAGNGKVLAIDSAALVLLDPRSSVQKVLLPAAPGIEFLQPYMLPDGRHVLFTAMRGSPTRAHIVSLDLQSGRVDTLLDGSSALRPQFADGRLYFVRPDGAVYGVGFDPKHARTHGTPVPTGDQAIVARTGRVAFAAGAGLLVAAQRPDNQVVALSPGGGREVLTKDPGTFHNPRVSRDGRRIVLDRNVGGRSGRDVWTLDLGSQALSRLTSKGDGHDPVWTPDGQHITYFSFATSDGPVFTVSADGAPGERAMKVQGLVHPGSWLPGGRGYVAGIGEVENGPSDIVILHPDGSPPEPLVTSPYEEHSPAVSPDGRLLAYMSDETGERQVYVRRMDGQGGRTLVSESSGEEPVWSRDGRRLYYVEHAGASSRLLAAQISPGNPPRVLSRQVVISPLRYEPVYNHANWDVTPTGRLIFVEPKAGSRLVMVFDWRPS